MSEDVAQQKQRLLRTPVSGLTLCETVTNYFLWDGAGHRNGISLQGFFNLNQTILEKEERFIVAADGRRGFSVSSDTWKIFRRFLIDAGFTHKDWMMLLPVIMGQNDYHSLGREQLAKVPLKLLYRFRPQSDTFQHLTAVITKRSWDSLSDAEKDAMLTVPVGKLLQITIDDVRAGFFFTGTFKKRHMISLEQAKGMIVMLKKIQMLLIREYRFDQTCGPFMLIDFAKIAFDRKGRIDPGQQSNLFDDAPRPDAHTDNFDRKDDPTVHLNEKLLGP